MVTFNEKSYTIEAYTGYNPVEDWLLTVKALCSVIGADNDSVNSEDRFLLSELLCSMLPDYDAAKKMFP